MSFDLDSGTKPVRTGLLLVLSGPSGSGKSTLGNICRERDPGLDYSISCTTRAPRGQERDGRDYHFFTRGEFDRRIDAGEFLEWAGVHGNCYGTLRREVMDRLERGLDVLLDIDVQGGIAVRRQLPLQSVLVFVLPPSWEILHRRLTGRGTDPPDSVAVRLDNARDEIALLAEYDYLIINDDLAGAADALMHIVAAERQRVARRLPFIGALGYEIECKE